MKASSSIEETDDASPLSEQQKQRTLGELRFRFRSSALKQSPSSDALLHDGEEEDFLEEEDQLARYVEPPELPTLAMHKVFGKELFLDERFITCEMCDRRPFGEYDITRLQRNTIFYYHNFYYMYIYTCYHHHQKSGALFWAMTFYCWYKVIGYFFVPLGIYFTSLVSPAFVRTKQKGVRETVIEESSGSTHLSAFAKREENAAKSVNEDVYRREHAEQVGIVVAMYAFLISAIFIFPPFFLFFAPFEWIKYLFLFYVAWYFVLDRDACEKGTRFLGWTRRLPFWRLAAGYFPVRLHKSADLDPSKNYIFGYHPHGVISVGALLTFASEATGFANAFPGIDVRLLTLSVNFFFPFTREVLMALGINSVTRSSVEKNLLRVKSSAAKKPRGNAVVIVVGGANEAMDAHPGTAILTLAKRKGFVRLALKTGATLVPVFAFGENDIFDQVENPEGGVLRAFQKRVKSLIGITPPAFYGRSLSRGVLRRFFGKRGVLPKRQSIEVVFGKPLEIKEKPYGNDQIPEDIVDKYHKEYVNALRNLYELHRKSFHRMKRTDSFEDFASRQKKMQPIRFK
ncbi:predicted protein [Bathycoccus prasinos]|uniref:diacylglycerol O-acyltransferase n=1 Tax=Bathycoccus prasinos TaxID=41875 RepID=K8EQD6_9CHLO|nr:predicted protein [Bathycoccus prasinos]CCO20432.1 predicted protein [Bathycoccus prasinos]|eukprot:XP_007508328.1 predicted protein [Bathycoccus prasinos]